MVKKSQETIVIYTANIKLSRNNWYVELNKVNARAYAKPKIEMVDRFCVLIIKTQQKPVSHHIEFNIKLFV